MIIILISSIAVFGIFLLPIAIYADAAPTSWSQVGNTINSNYTSAQCNFTSTGVNIVLGMANGTIGYWNGTAWTEMQPGSQITSGGTNNGSSITALYCNWGDSLTYPDVIAGYANGDIQYLNASTLKWTDLGIPSANQQVTKLGGVSIDSSNNITGCNAETATVPSTAVTPVDYTNKQLWTYNGTNWSMLLQNPGTTCIDADMSLGNGVSGLSNGDIQQNGSYDANVSSNPISSVAYLGQNNGQNEYFYADNNADYGIGYFNSTSSFSATSISTGSSSSNYTYTSVSPSANGSQSVIVANNALRIFNVNNNYASLSANDDLWSDPDNTAFNGLSVDWNGSEPSMVVAGLTNGQLVVGRGTESSGYQTYSAPPNFPSNGEGCSQTFASFNSSSFTAVQIFNNNNNSCYIYKSSNTFPSLSINTYGFGGLYYVDVVDPQILGSCTVFFTSSGISVSGGVPPYSISYSNVPQWVQTNGFNGIRNQSYLYVGEYGLNAPIIAAPIQGNIQATVTDSVGNIVTRNLWINFIYNNQ